MKSSYTNEQIDRVISLVEDGLSITKASIMMCNENGIPYVDSIRRYFSKVINSQAETVTDTNQYISEVSMSAQKRDGSIMSIEEYCSVYGIPFEHARTYKLVTHTGTPYYNIASNVLEQESYVSEQELKDLIKEGLESVKLTSLTDPNASNYVGVVKLADLHLGAYVDNLIRTKNFSIDILANKLFDAATEVNKRDYSVVHIHILGDLIESFTGLSHKNTWKGLDKAMVGAEAVKLVVKILHDNFLSRIKNLGEVKVVAGNHDRVTSDNKEDVQGGAANLVCWGLELIGYNVEFNPLVITHYVDGICHILTHGHHPISKKSTKQLCWDYGMQGVYNLICEGHLHSIIQKLNVNQRDSYQTIKDDAVDHRRINCPSFFTGNFFSESLGYTSESGFIITENNGKGVPNVFYYAI